MNSEMLVALEKYAAQAVADLAVRAFYEYAHGIAAFALGDEAEARYHIAEAERLQAERNRYEDMRRRCEAARRAA